MENPVVRALGVSCLLALLGAASAQAVYQVEEWSAQWGVFFDDFEDGVLPDRVPVEEPLHYASYCGGASGNGLADEDETGDD